MTGGSDGDAGSRGGGGGGSWPAGITTASAAGMPPPRFAPLSPLPFARRTAFLLREERGPLMRF